VEAIGHCDLHDKPVGESEFEWKGCWTCWHFSYRNWPYISVREAAERYNVTERTIYRWIKQGNLEAKLFVMGRRNTNFPKRFYGIITDEKEEISRS